MNKQDQINNLEYMSRKLLSLGEAIGAKAEKNRPLSTQGVRELCRKEFDEADGLIAAIKAIAESDCPWPSDRGGRRPC